MSREIRVEADAVAIGKVNALKPTESDFIGKKGYRRYYRKNGSYSWRYGFKPNVNGKLTKEAIEVGELMRPFQVADSERQAALSAKAERVTLRDRDGGVRHLDPALADDAARRHGWRHGWRARGCRVVPGPDGMLWRLVVNEWMPLGVRCMGTPLTGSAQVSRSRPQRDPDGNLWRYRAGRWQAV